MTAAAPATRLTLEEYEAEEHEEVLWRPNPGPQTAACAAGEFEAFYGGAKGGGKSDVVVFRPLLQTHIPTFKALILREDYTQLEELIRRSFAVYPRLPSKPVWNAFWKRWDFPNPETRTGAGGASVKFGHCANIRDVQKYQGQEWGEVLFDELGNIPDERVWVELLKEIRCKDPRVVRRALGTGNPGYAGHAWIKRRWIKHCGADGSRVYVYELDVPGIGTVRKHRRFIPARVWDNPTYARDPDYLATLMSLPEERRRQLLYGDWDAGVGLALPQLDEDVHFVRPFEPPAHWIQFGGFDWGFAHNWVYVWCAVSEDGDIVVLDTVKGRQELPDEIARKIRTRTRLERVKYVAAGRDCWHVHRARGENTPTIAEWLIGAGIPLIKANTDPVHGLNNLRDYTAWRARGPRGEDTDPALFFMDTPGNRWLFEQCASMVTDPDDPEKALKVDADPETGEGGDDGYDALRYAVASRPPRPRSIWAEEQIRAWDPTVLEHEAKESRRVRTPRPVDEDLDPMLMVSLS